MASALELVEAFISAGEIEDACGVLDQHLQTFPHDADAHRLRAELLLHLPDRTRNLQDALRDLDALPQVTPADLLLRAQVLSALGDAEGEFAAVEQAWQMDHDLRTADLLLQLLYRQGETDRALALLAGLPKTWRWLCWSADFYVQAGEDAVAEAHYCSALDDLAQSETNAIRDLQRAVLLLKRADVYHRLERWMDADADYRAAAMIIPNDAAITMLRAQLAAERDGKAD